MESKTPGSIDNVMGATPPKTTKWWKRILLSTSAVIILAYGINILYNEHEASKAIKKAEEISNQLNKALSTYAANNVEISEMYAKLETHYKSLSDDLTNNPGFYCREQVWDIIKVFSVGERELMEAQKKRQDSNQEYILLKIKKEPARVISLINANKYLRCAKNPFCE